MLKKRKKESDALLQLPGGGQLQCLDLFPQRQQYYWRYTLYTAIIFLCHTPGRTRGDSDIDRRFIK